MCVCVYEQVYPIRASTCNLHGKNNKAGFTAIIPHFNIKQYILGQDYSSHGDLWLEAGGISLGPLNVDTAMALPSPEFHIIQDQFLKLHDKHTHRLWFLWPPDLSVMSPKVVGKCGCIGGCKFFGKNRNGPQFFHPSDQDFLDSINAAVFHMITDGVELGYGQSLLHKGQLMFDIQNSAMPATPSKNRMEQKGYLGSKMSMDTPRTSTTLVDDFQRQASLLGFISDHSGSQFSEQRNSEISGSDRTLKDSYITKQKIQGNPDRESGLSFGTNSIPSDYIPEDPMPDAYDTDKYGSTPSDTGITWISGASGSVTSLPEAVQTKSKPFGHERKYSYDAKQGRGHFRKPSENTISSDSYTVGSPTSFSTRDSKSSIPSSSGHSDFKSVSRQSSLTSPVLRRLSSQHSMQHEGSIASTTGSEMFFSAAESLESGSDPNLLGYDGQKKAFSWQMPGGSDRTNAAMMSSSWTDTPSTLRGYGSDITGSPTILQQTVIHHRRQSSTASTDTESVTSFVSAVSSQHTSMQDVRKNPSQPDLFKDQLRFFSPPTYSEAIAGERQTWNPDVQDSSQNHNTDEMEDTDVQYMETPSASNDVDLHGQLNQQITKSPLLMSCYINHLTQLSCYHWAAPPPLPHLVAKPQQLLQDPSSSFHSRISTVMGEHPLAPAWIPQFMYTKDGFGPNVMVDKREPRTPPSLSSPSSGAEWEKPKKVKDAFELQEGQ